MRRTKFLTVAALLVLLLSSLFTGGVGKVSAEGEEATLEMHVSRAEGKVGDTVTVTVSLTENPGIAGIIAWVRYDKTALRVNNVETSNDVFVASTPPRVGDDFVGYAIAEAEDTMRTGQLFAIEFEIIEGATAGDTELTFSGLNGEPEAANAAGDDVDFNFVPEKGTKITIIGEDCKHTNSSVVGEPVPPTCTVDGSQTFRCNDCGKEWTEILYAPGHKADDMEVNPEESETEEGKITATCTVCGYEEEWTIPPIRKEEFRASIFTGGRVLEDAEIVEGTMVSFTASIQGVNQEEQGKVRYVPTGWKLGQQSGGIAAAGSLYSASVQMGNRGDQKMDISYDRQFFNGTQWVTYGTYTYTATVHVTEKRQNTPGSSGNEPKPTNPPASGSNGNAGTSAGSNGNAGTSAGSNGNTGAPANTAPASGTSGSGESSTNVPAAAPNDKNIAPKTGEVEGRGMAAAIVLFGISSCMITVSAIRKKRAK